MASLVKRVIPPIDLDNIEKHIGSDGLLDTSRINKFIDILQIEQPYIIFSHILCGALINPNMFKGFLLAYMLIRDAIIKRECDDLEKLAK